MMYLAIAYLLTVTIMSLAAFVLYGIDKRRARNNMRRVPERRLHLIALCGGWPGAWIGQRVFRHKTAKLRFRVVFWLVVVVHISVVSGVAYLVIQWP